MSPGLFADDAQLLEAGVARKVLQKVLPSGF